MPASANISGQGRQIPGKRFCNGIASCTWRLHLNAILGICPYTASATSQPISKPFTVWLANRKDGGFERRSGRCQATRKAHHEAAHEPGPRNISSASVLSDVAHAQSTSCPDCVSRLVGRSCLTRFAAERLAFYISHFAGISTIVIHWEARMLRYWPVLLSQELVSGEGVEVLVVLDVRVVD